MANGNGNGSEFALVPMNQQPAVQHAAAVPSSRNANNGNGANGDARQRLANVLSRINQLAAQQGVDASGLLQEMTMGNGNGACACDTGKLVDQYFDSPQFGQQSSPLQAQFQYIPWEKRLGTCPPNISRVLCWMWKGLCSFNQMGRPGSVRLNTDPD